MLKYLAGVTTLELDVETCTGCGVCVVVCPHAVLAIEGTTARIVDLDACMECGACSRNCPVGALQVDAGVGCATGVIFSALGKDRDCCCE